MRFTVNKETKTIELHSGIIIYEDIKGLLEEFEGFSFLISPQKSEKQGMVVGANYISIIGNTEYN